MNQRQSDVRSMKISSGENSGVFTFIWFKSSSTRITRLHGSNKWPETASLKQKVRLKMLLTGLRLGWTSVRSGQCCTGRQAGRRMHWLTNVGGMTCRMIVDTADLSWRKFTSSLCATSLNHPGPAPWSTHTGNKARSDGRPGETTSLRYADQLVMGKRGHVDPDVARGALFTAAPRGLHQHVYYNQSWGVGLTLITVCICRRLNSWFSFPLQVGLSLHILNYIGPREGSDV